MMRSTTQITWQNLSPSDDIEANIREHIAFERAERQLKEYTQRQRGEIKTHKEKEGNETGAN